MERLTEYSFGRLGGSGRDTLDLKQRIVQNLGNKEGVFEELEDSAFEPHERWFVLSSLVRENPHCPRLFDLRDEYVQELKSLPEERRRRCWSKIECNLNDEERKLWRVEEVNFDELLKLALLIVMIICLSLGFYSKTRFLGDEPVYVFLGALLIFPFIVAFIFVASNFFLKLKRRESTRTLGLINYI